MEEIKTVTREERGQKTTKRGVGEERALRCRNDGSKKLLVPKLWRTHYLLISDLTLNLK